MLKNNGLYSREVIGVFGKITYTRTALKPADPESTKRLQELESKNSIYPLDSVLGVDVLPFKITCEMMCLIAREAVRERSYEKAAERVHEIYHVDISSVQVEKVTDFIGNCVLEEQRRLAEEAEKQSHIKPDGRRRRRRANDVLYCSMDGAFVHVRDKGAGDGEKGKDAWVESKHAVVFHSSKIKYYDNREGEPAHKILKKEFTGYIGPVSEFKYHFLALAMRNGYDVCTEVVVLSDGAAWVHNIVEEFFPKYMHILDLFHVKETVGKFAIAVIRGKEDKKKKFADEICDLIEGGEIDKALERLEPYKDKKLPNGVPNAYTYIKNNRGQMDYPLYKSLGYFVGSGVMESGNKQLMQSRMKLQGMRWTTEGARRMLSLKAKYESGDWEDVYKIVRRKLYKDDYEQTYCRKLKAKVVLRL